jgi:prepilin-type N-terminal cleavage/methylation domain-containing protein
MNKLIEKIPVKEAGFTLVELLVVLAITAIVGIGIATSIDQVIGIHSSTVNHMQAIKQVENAQLYLNRDCSMAQTIDTTSGPGLFTITYRDWENGWLYTIIYSIITPINGDPKYLERSEQINSNTPTLLTIANNIDDTQTNCSYDSALKQFAINLTATVEGYKPATETRLLKIRLRSIQ